MGCYASKPDNGFPMHHLPTEILVKILFQLDGYSLNNVFDAFSTIARRFVLITDRPQTAVFTCTSLRRVELHDFKKGSFRAYLQAFELRAQGDRRYPHGMGFDSRRYTKFCSSLNSYCFVHLTDVRGNDRWVTRFMGDIFLTGATVESSNCLPGTILSNPSTSQICKVCESGVRSLIIKNVSVVESFELSKNLESLTIIFNASSKIPRLEAISLPRSFRNLTIVFYRDFPSIAPMTHNPKLTSWSFRPVTLELTNAASMTTAIGALPPTHTLFGNGYTDSLSSEFQDRITRPFIVVACKLTNIIGVFSDAT